MSSRRWVFLSLLVLGVFGAFCLWAKWRPAMRFNFRELKPGEFRLVTWNVGYFALAGNKNLRDIDITRIVQTLKDVSPNAVVLQEVGSTGQAEEISKGLGPDWSSFSVKTGHSGQVLSVLSNLPGKLSDTKEAGGRELIGVSLGNEPEQAIFIAGVHSPHPARGIANTAENIRGAVSMAEAREEPVRIVAGDLNYNFDLKESKSSANSLYQEITRIMSDSTAELGETYYAHTRIDHVFHFPKELKVINEASGIIDLSVRFDRVPGFRDHRPIVITYDLSGVF